MSIKRCSELKEKTRTLDYSQQGGSLFSVAFFSESLVGKKKPHKKTKKNLTSNLIKLNFFLLFSFFSILLFVAITGGIKTMYEKKIKTMVSK